MAAQVQQCTGKVSSNKYYEYELSQLLILAVIVVGVVRPTHIYLVVGNPYDSKN